MASTLRIDATIETRDAGVLGGPCMQTIKDAGLTSHEYVDPTPINVGTLGSPGTSFIPLRTSVVQVERLMMDVPPGSDLVLRVGGLVAALFGVSAAPTFVGGETLVLAVDTDSAPTTTTFASGDTTIADIARRINFAHRAQVAGVDALGRLTLVGFRTGGADARAKQWSYGRLSVGGGTAVAALGLQVGDVYGAGDDQRIGPGPFVKTFPAGALPRLLELSGAAAGVRSVVAGKAS